MRILELYLKNFRNVAEKTYYFPANFTVIIGINGRGKSTLLHAMRVACGTYFLGIPEVTSRHIVSDEIRVVDNLRFLASQTPVVVEAKGTFTALGTTPIVWRRRIDTAPRNTSTQADVGQVRDLGKQKFDQMTAGGEEADHLDLPLVAYFGTSRVHGAARQRTPRARARRIYVEGYRDWFEMRSTTYLYESWLATFDAFARQGREYVETKDVFFQTLYKANPRHLKEVDFVDGKLWLRVDMEGYESQLLPLNLHSDGIITYMEMVAEIACRCIILNGYKRTTAVSETTGIVMIDEIDLHLHPTWQKHVVADLKNAFPNIQFVATTHSPLIVQSLDRSELLNLDNEALTQDSPDNLPLNQVVTEIMGVDGIRSDNFEERYLTAKAELAQISLENGNLTISDYESISKLLGGILREETNDPTFRAYLDESENAPGQ
jgi:predicted ATP-binding protein involved in virulence